MIWNLGNEEKQSNGQMDKKREWKFKGLNRLNLVKGAHPENVAERFAFDQIPPVFANNKVVTKRRDLLPDSRQIRTVPRVEILEKLLEDDTHSVLRDFE